LDTRVDVGRIRSQTRELSKSLLGAQYRAEVAAFIGEGEAPFWARGMAKQLDIPENKVAAELSRFAEQNLLVASSDSVWDRRTLYEPSAESAGYWAAGSELVRRAAKDEASRLGIDTETALTTYLVGVHNLAYADHGINADS
jgi:hypothetical protein